MAGYSCAGLAFLSDIFVYTFHVIFLTIPKRVISLRIFLFVQLIFEANTFKNSQRHVHQRALCKQISANYLNNSWIKFVGK